MNDRIILRPWLDSDCGDYFPSNPASGRVMEKCGFVNTGKYTLIGIHDTIAQR